MNVRGLCIAGGLLLVLGGCSLTTSFVVRDWLARVPRLTCADLARDGPSPDGRVTITDLRRCGGGAVATHRDGDLDLYVPAYPADLKEEPGPAGRGAVAGHVPRVRAGGPGRDVAGRAGRRVPPGGDRDELARGVAGVWCANTP